MVRPSGREARRSRYSVASCADTVDATRINRQKAIARMARMLGQVATAMQNAKCEIQTTNSDVQTFRIVNVEVCVTTRPSPPSAPAAWPGVRSSLLRHAVRQPSAYERLSAPPPQPPQSLRR